MTTRTGDVRRVHATLAPIAIALCSCAGGCVTASLPHVGVPLAGSSEAGATVGAMGGIAGVGNTSASLPAGAFAGAFIVSKPAPFFELSAAAGGGALASSLSANHWLVEGGGAASLDARLWANGLDLPVALGVEAGTEGAFDVRDPQVFPPVWWAGSVDAHALLAIPINDAFTFGVRPGVDVEWPVPPLGPAVSTILYYALPVGVAFTSRDMRVDVEVTPEWTYPLLVPVRASGGVAFGWLL